MPPQGARPVVATSYLNQIVRDFEEYGKSHLVPALDRKDVDPVTMLAALRFAATRALTKQEKTIKEVLTTPRRGALSREIGDAGIEALLRTCENRSDAATFLLSMAMNEGEKDVAALGERGLKTTGASGREAILTELSKPAPGARLRKLARMLMEMSKAKPPEGIKFWESADVAARVKTCGEWRAKLSENGEL